MIPSGTLVDGLDKTRVDTSANNCLHHGQVLEIIMGLEEGIPSEELNEDATDAPDIAGEGPPQSENDLRRAVVPGGHNR